MPSPPDATQPGSRYSRGSGRPCNRFPLPVKPKQRLRHLKSDLVPSPLHDSIQNPPNLLRRQDPQPEEMPVHSVALRGGGHQGVVLPHRRQQQRRQLRLGEVADGDGFGQSDRLGGGGADLQR